MIRVKLTPAQRSACEIYIADPAHELHDEVTLDGRALVFTCDADRAREIINDGSNSADVGDGCAPDRGAALALANILPKLREVTK